MLPDFAYLDISQLRPDIGGGPTSGAIGGVDDLDGIDTTASILVREWESGQELMARATALESAFAIFRAVAGGMINNQNGARCPGAADLAGAPHLRHVSAATRPATTPLTAAAASSTIICGAAGAAKTTLETSRQEYS